MPQDDSPTFETALDQLEKIVEQMESESLPIEDLLTRYEQGLKLVKFCSEKLEAAEKRIEIITRGAGGKPKLVEFEPASKSTPETASSSTGRPAPGDVHLF